MRNEKMKSTFISRDGSPLNIDPFNLCDGETWNKTIVALSGTEMSLHYRKLIDQAESANRRRYSVARKLMHGSVAVTNEFLIRLTSETANANNLRGHEIDCIPVEKNHTSKFILKENK